MTDDQDKKDISMNSDQKWIVTSFPKSLLDVDPRGPETTANMDNEPL